MYQSPESFPEQMKNTPYACENTKRICQQQQNTQDITPAVAAPVRVLASATPTKVPVIATAHVPY